jgi:hypothetical protein
MNEHLHEKSGHRANPSSRSDAPARPLYVRGAHALARTGFTMMLLFYLAGVVGVASTFTAHPLGWRDAVGFLVLILFPLLVATNLRTWAVYGSVDGIEVVRWGTHRIVPWSQVGAPEYAWWSLNYAARVARLTIDEERSRNILFFANDRLLEEIERMRALYARG